jgi:hypothetical protein
VAKTPLPQSSAVLLDPNYGLGPWIALGVIQASVGILGIVAIQPTEGKYASAQACVEARPTLEALHFR